MRRRHVIAALGALSLAAIPVVAPATPPPIAYSAGAATVSVSPPQNGPRVGSDVCPDAVWTGPSHWDQDEPYVDLNDSGEWDIGGPEALPEPFCDANHNGRYDGIWVVGQVAHHARRLNDEIWARTFAVSDGRATVAVTSVDSLGLFNTDVEKARAIVRAEHPGLAELFVSSNHNESSPDPIGLWGPSVISDDAPASQTSGVDDYYMDFLARRIADSVTEALADMRPASLRVVETTAPTIVPDLHHWPTTNRRDDEGATPPPAAGRIDAWDPKVHVLQARDVATSETIFTMVGYDAHVQNLGHSDDPKWSYAITADWVGFFNADVEAAQGGVAIYLQGANGSIETPQVPSRRNAEEGTIERSEDIGKELAAIANAALTTAVPLAVGRVEQARDVFNAPLENQLFLAAFAAGLFPHRTLVPPDPAHSHDRPDLRTEVGGLRIGPLLLMANPGEAFPSLIRGSHWGADEGCASRANPPVPSSASTAPYRWDMGLANDMIGYLIPAWGWDESAAVYANPVDGCTLGETSEGGHHHGLETESVGPTAGNLVAEHLTALVARLNHGARDPSRVGRYLFADGTLSRRPYVAPFQHDGVVDPIAHAVGMVVRERGHTRVVTLPGVDVARPFTADAHGSFVDFDGRVQAQPDQTTRGMLFDDGRTVYLDVFPAFAP